MRGSAPLSSLVDDVEVPAMVLVADLEEKSLSPGRYFTKSGLRRMTQPQRIPRLTSAMDQMPRIAWVYVTSGSPPRART